MNCQPRSEIKNSNAFISAMPDAQGHLIYLRKAIYQVCTENSSGSISQFAQQIASLADVRLGGTLKA